jgi:hypothetical protein
MKRAFPLFFVASTGRQFGGQIWQQLFLMPRSHGFFAFFLPVTAFGSWILLERPCIRIGKRIENRLIQPQPIHPVAPAPDDLGVDEASSAVSI